ncbi:uncharacterized protein LOC129874591 isoform X2 [Solanum dulcamara]|uniref:uncharacterized protein LOC129874591 isoform X2 n=1 Tax=Solanum dulcamara TaxID=45834 RepID=UPI00248558F2|nr:uncharacterized protein LOC129874591 isoform X2 [Solanum dulcamara]
MENVESLAKAAMEKLKEMNIVENAKEVVKTSTPFVTNFVRISFDWLLENTKEIVEKTTPFVRTSSDGLLEKAPPRISMAKNWIQKAPPRISMAKNWIQKAPPRISMAKNWIQKAPLYYTIPIGFLLILLLYRCCGGGGGGNGKTMKAPGRKNVRISRPNFQRDPKSYFRDLHSKKN